MNGSRRFNRLALIRPRGEPQLSFENIGFMTTFFDFLFMIGSHNQDFNVGKLNVK